jgi:tripartite-type tricarboxylate transporter receptor subunit TctC
MVFNRRTFLATAAGTATLGRGLRRALAQSYPSRSIRWVVPFPPGGSTDIVARLIGQQLSERFGQSVIIENRGGAGANIGIQAVVNSPPDGYTMLLVPTGATINPSLYASLPFNFLRDITPVAGLVRSPNVMVVNPSFPARTVGEFIAYARANPHKVNLASPGTGTAVHLAGEMFKVMANINMTHVPYKGGALATADLIGGQVQVLFDVLAGAYQHIQAGSTRPLAVTTARRAEILPDVPAISETLPGYDASTWFGVGVPSGTPPEIVKKLNAEINAALAQPTVQAKLRDIGIAPLILSPEEFAAHVKAETAKYARIVKEAGIKLD